MSGTMDPMAAEVDQQELAQQLQAQAAPLVTKGAASHRVRMR